MLQIKLEIILKKISNHRKNLKKLSDLFLMPYFFSPCGVIA